MPIRWTQGQAFLLWIRWPSVKVEVWSDPPLGAMRHGRHHPPGVTRRIRLLPPGKARPRAGLLRLDPDQSQVLFILPAHPSTRGAPILTSNLEFRDSSYRFRQSLAAPEARPDQASGPVDEPDAVSAPR